MIQDVIVAPIISEKSMQDATLGKFAFRTTMLANKRSIKDAIEKRFKVKVIDVATNIVKGKKIRVGRRRTEVLRSPWKKTIVTLSKGQKIDLFEASAKT